MSSQMKIQHLDDFIKISDKHEITLEFEKSEFLVNALNEYRESIISKEFDRKFKESTFMLLYELDLNESKVVSCSAMVSPGYVCLTPYSVYVSRHLQMIRHMFERFPVLDFDGGFMISWSGKTPYNMENLEGFGYVIPTYVPIGSPPVTITDTEIISFYEKSLLSPKIRKFLMDQFDTVGPYYAEFAKEDNTPSKYGFHAHIFEGLIEKHYQIWKDYKNMQGVFEMLKSSFFGSLISLQFSTKNEDYIGIEFGIPVDVAPDFIDKLCAYKCVDESIISKLRTLKLPDFLDNVVFKFRWENEHIQNLKVYMESQSRELIEDTF